MEDEKLPLDYAPSQRSRLIARPATIAYILLMFACSAGAVGCAAVTIGHLKEMHFSPQYLKYLQGPRLSPFVGVQVLPHPGLWHYPSTYGAAIFATVAIALFVLGIRSADEQHHPPH